MSGNASQSTSGASYLHTTTNTRPQALIREERAVVDVSYVGYIVERCIDLLCPVVRFACPSMSMRESSTSAAVPGMVGLGMLSPAPKGYFEQLYGKCHTYNPCDDPRQHTETYRLCGAKPVDDLYGLYV